MIDPMITAPKQYSSCSDIFGFFDQRMKLGGCYVTQKFESCI